MAGETWKLFEEQQKRDRERMKNIGLSLGLDWNPPDISYPDIGSANPGDPSIPLDQDDIDRLKKSLRNSTKPITRSHN